MADNILKNGEGVPRKVVFNRIEEVIYESLERNFRGGIDKHHYNVEGDFVAGLIYCLAGTQE